MVGGEESEVACSSNGHFAGCGIVVLREAGLL